MKKTICGIQQMGVGVKDIQKARLWYRSVFGMDVEVFEEAATAQLMLPHTEGKPIPRHAILAMNMQGGGGFEIWQQTKYEPQPPAFELQLGDLGYFACKMRCRNAAAFLKFATERGAKPIGHVMADPAGGKSVFLRDPWGNLFHAVETDEWYRKGTHLSGGVYGAVIGVSDMEKALPVWSDLLGHDEVVFDETGEAPDLGSLPGGSGKIRRVLLRNKTPRKGPFARLLGGSQIELIQALDRTPRSIFEGRIWGDLGFIHLCFDTRGMDLLKEEARTIGHPFTVDSAESFDMGVAAGRFSYITDPDGTLVEFVETHKLPIIKKLGWYMKLEKFPPEKHLPNWMVNTLSWKRKK
jgi:catechol 2,3-dioxygenase-like lactoylglutathione lyase family enzyme